MVDEAAAAAWRTRLAVVDVTAAAAWKTRMRRWRRLAVGAAVPVAALLRWQKEQQKCHERLPQSAQHAAQRGWSFAAAWLHELPSPRLPLVFSTAYFPLDNVAGRDGRQPASARWRPRREHRSCPSPDLRHSRCHVEGLQEGKASWGGHMYPIFRVSCQLRFLAQSCFAQERAVDLSPARACREASAAHDLGVPPGARLRTGAACHACNLLDRRMYALLAEKTKKGAKMFGIGCSRSTGALIA